MSEQENKVPTAVEIERALRERRQQELEQASTDSDKGDAAEPDKRLGIDKLKKSRKGLVVIIVAFLLLAIGVPNLFNNTSRCLSSGYHLCLQNNQKR